MEQRTCNIIMLCKSNNNKYGNDEVTVINSIAKYMGEECIYPWEAYSYEQLEEILMTALYDYIDGADKPSVELRNLFNNSVFARRSFLDKICSMFCQTQVREKSNDGNYYFVNGFTQELIDVSGEILGVGNN